MTPTLLLTRAALQLADRAHRRLAESDDRGDVPAWVMITVMTAGIVGVLWSFAQDGLKTLLSDAFKSAATKG